ncbi:MAG TPA: hypothetical protein VGF26_07520 [Ramlibacter sp.]
MQRLFSAKPVLAIAVALGSLAAASGAHAGIISNAVVSVSVGTPVRHVQPAPVHVQPAPVHMQPRVAQGWQRPHGSHGPWGDTDHDGVPNRYDRHDDRRVAYGPWGDADRDGVPNRYDRAPNNPYRR